MNYERRVLEFEDHLFIAEEEDTERGALISTYVSPLVDKLDPLWYSIRKTLSQSCYSASEPRIIRDSDMMFGYAQSVEFEIFDSCPGDIKHYCMAERRKSLTA